MTVLREMRRVLRQDGHVALITALGHATRLEPVPYAPHTKRWFFYRDPAELDDQLRRAEFSAAARVPGPGQDRRTHLPALGENPGPQAYPPAGAPAAMR